MIIMKKSKILVLIALVLCFSMLFVACGGNKEGEGTPTTPPADNNGGAVSNPETDIKMLVDRMNADPTALAIEPAVYAMLAGINAEVSDIKLNGEAIEDAPSIVAVKGGTVYMAQGDEAVYVVIDDTLAALSIGVEGDNVYTELIADILADMDMDMDEMDIPEEAVVAIEASDLTNEGNGVYSLNKAYFEEAIEKALKYSAGESAEDPEVAEMINTYMDIVKGCDIRLAYTVKNSAVVASEIALKVSEATGAKIAELAGMPALGESYSGEVKLVFGLTNDVPTSVNAEVKLYMPVDMSSDSVTFVDVNGTVSLDLANLAAMKADVTYKMINKQYTVNGDTFTLVGEPQTMETSIKAGVESGVFKLTTTSKMGDESQTTEITANVAFGSANIPEMNDAAKAELEKFNKIADNKAAIDAFAEELAAKIAAKCDDNMMYSDLIYTYSEYGINLSFYVTQDWSGSEPKLTVRYEGFDFVDAYVYYDYTVTVDGDNVTFTPKAGTPQNGGSAVATGMAA